MGGLVWADDSLDIANSERPSVNSNEDVHGADEDGMTLLMYAATHGNVEQLQALIDCDVHAKLANGATALSFAAVRRSHEHVKVLIDSGADISGIDLNDDTEWLIPAHHGMENER
ncbi:hypothetical protein M9434_001093 [Picochlorum sp. BPE23]|nr:hypothetical protein M9434_001093 [Picochlorum sp. BPE23]